MVGRFGENKPARTWSPYVLESHRTNLLTNEILEIVADKLSAAGWSWGYCRAVTRNGWRWIVDANRDDGRRYIVRSDELLSAFLELEAIVL